MKLDGRRDEICRNWLAKVNPSVELVSKLKTSNNLIINLIVLNSFGEYLHCAVSFLADDFEPKMVRVNDHIVISFRSFVLDLRNLWIRWLKT